MLRPNLYQLACASPVGAVAIGGWRRAPRDLQNRCKGTKILRHIHFLLIRFLEKTQILFVFLLA
jgi:hypothetical protein